jgi:hypothetical protein
MHSAIRNLEEKFVGCPHDIYVKVKELCEETKNEIVFLKDKFSPHK